MSVEPAVHDMFTLERIYRAPAASVFDAWGDPAKKRLWFAEGEGWEVLDFRSDFRVGGFERSRFRFEDGPEVHNDTLYHDIVPGRRIVSSYSMTVAGKNMSVSLLTVEFEPAGAETRFRLTEQAAFLENSDGVDRRRTGWGELLDRLGTALVQA
jgi:uncharacterized protein YndB with AHSA1/START domain